MCTRTSTSSSLKRFLVAAASASSIASKMTSRLTPFSLDTVSATSRISLFMARPLQRQLSQTFQAEHSRLDNTQGSVELRHHVGAVNLREWDRQCLTVHGQMQVVTHDGGNVCRKSAAVRHWREQADLHFFANVELPLFQREQRPIHARRGHFQRVLAGDRVFHVQHTADLMADLSAIVHGN